MKKILLSLGSILFAGAMIAGGTGAFLGDRERSTGNTFATGVIDLLIDNESYITNNEGVLSASPETSWDLSGLSGKLFFNFLDVKPGDIGEDTISVHVKNNNAWACMSLALTGTPENGQSEPEALVDETSGEQEGELEEKLYFAFWADDGDNVFEDNEGIFKEGLAKDLFNGSSWRLADSTGNLWLSGNNPIPAGSTKYIGKAWCLGKLSPEPVEQDGFAKTGSNGPLARGPGFSCGGHEPGNELQTDGLLVDVVFDAIQARNNKTFTCESGFAPETFTLFFENFESSQLNSDFSPVWNPRWTQSGGAQAVWGLDGKVADLDGPGTERLTSKTINASIYHDINLSYDRKLDDTNAPPVGGQTFLAEYSVDNGANWTTLENVSGETSWTTKNFSLSPSADFKSEVKIRFTLTGDDASNHAYVDNVRLSGITP